jgi:peptidoglycan/LPS O-acetylase OafA/YrhL
MLERSNTRIHAPTALALGVAIFAVTAAIESATGHWHSFAYGAGSAIALLGLVRLERAGITVGGGPAAQLLGNASYSLYLVHYPIISATCRAASVLEASAFVAAIVAPLASVTAALALHYGIERPVMRGQATPRTWPPEPAAPGGG